MTSRDDAARIAAARADATTPLTSLAAHVNALAEHQALATHDDEHDPGGMTIGFERAQILGLLTGAPEEVAALDRAAARLRTGAHGRCLNCRRAGGVDHHDPAAPSTPASPACRRWSCVRPTVRCGSLSPHSLSRPTVIMSMP